MKTRTNGQQTHQPHTSAEPPSRSQHRPRSACRVSSLAWALLRIFQTPPFFPRLSPFLQPLPIAAAPPDAAPPIHELIPPHQAPWAPFIDAALYAAQMAPAQRRRPRSDSQDSDSLLPATAAPPLRCPPIPPSARHRRNELPDASAVTVHKAQGMSLAFFHRPSSWRRNSPSAARTCSSRVQPPCLASSSRTPWRSSCLIGLS